MEEHLVDRWDDGGRLEELVDVTLAVCAVRRGAVRCGAVRCDAVRGGAVACRVLPFRAVQCPAEWWRAASCAAVLCCAVCLVMPSLSVPRDAALYCAVRCRAVLPNPRLHAATVAPPGACPRQALVYVGANTIWGLPVDMWAGVLVEWLIL